MALGSSPTRETGSNSEGGSLQPLLPLVLDRNPYPRVSPFHLCRARSLATSRNNRLPGPFEGNAVAPTHGNDYPMPPLLHPPVLPKTPQSPHTVGACLSLFLPHWQSLLPHNEWVLAVIRDGLQLCFQQPPALQREPRWIKVPRNTEKCLALRSEVSSLLEKGAVETVYRWDSPGFYSHLFVVPKSEGRWRPVIDLSVLNRHLRIPSFTMETARLLRASIDPKDFAVSIDLKDAYLHVPMHPNTRRYLRFAIDNQVYTFRAMPFGLATAPWAFTKMMEAVIAAFRRSVRSSVSHYLDDLLLRQTQAQVLARDLNQLCSLLRSLGWIINEDKSDMIPSQTFVHLGMRFDTKAYLVAPTQKRVDKIVSVAHQLSSQKTFTPRQMAEFLGLASSVMDLVPQGGLRLRPLQWTFSQMWNQTSEDWDVPLQMSQPLRECLLPWIDPPWLLEGVPIRHDPPVLSLCTDASNSGWGAHLLPSMEMVAGQWSVEERYCHINELEMLAVIRAVGHWRQQLMNQTVSVLSDNTTVCAYIRHQGGTKSRALCQRTLDLIQLTAPLKITLIPRHIPGRLNVIADGLSRDTPLHTEWMLNDRVFQLLLHRFPTMQVDLFATRHNNRLPTFVSPFPDPQAVAIDGLTFNWEGQDLYAFPPAVIIPKVVQRLSQFHCVMTLIAPLQWNRPWISSLRERLLCDPLKLPVCPDLLLQPRSGLLHNSLETLNLHAFRLSGGPCLTEDTTLKWWTESSPLVGLPL